MANHRNHDADESDQILKKLFWMVIGAAVVYALAVIVFVF